MCARLQVLSSRPETIAGCVIYGPAVSGRLSELSPKTDLLTGITESAVRRVHEP